MAIQHQQAGRLQAAEQIYRQILDVVPNHPDVIHHLGLLARQMGQHEKAVEYFQRAIEINGSAAVFHYSLGEAYRALRRIPEAVACYRRALELKPDFAGVHVNLGNILKDQGKLEEAIACYRRAIEIKPDFVVAHNNLGRAFGDQGKLDEAIACYRRALELTPDDAGVQVSLGNVLKDRGKLDDAVACYRRATELKPAFAEAHYNLGGTLRDQGKLDEAVACYRQALELRPDDAGAYNNLGVVLNDQGRMEEAVACYRRALELKPEFAGVHINLGDARAEIGDLRGAEDCFRAALRQNPRLISAHCKLAQLLGGKLPQNDLAAQRRLLDVRELTDAERSWLHFGLAHVMDARGEYAEAAQHTERGHELRRSEARKHGREYNPEEYERLVTRMLAACTPDFFARVRGFGLESELPVFIVGLPRSGTTLIEQILASHSQVFGAGEIKLARDTAAAMGGHDADLVQRFGRLDCQTAQRFASQHLQKLRALNSQSLRIVDKTPENYLYLGLLASLFPRAKLIHCRRDLRDVAVSCWMTPFQELRWADDRQHIASRFHEYRRMMEYWRKVLPAPLLEVDYEETVADLEGVARKLVAWCGLAWEPRCLEFHQAKRPVKTASAVQVRQPVFRTSVGRWKHYQPALGSLLAQLERDQIRSQ